MGILGRYRILTHYLRSPDVRGKVSFYEVARRLVAPPLRVLAKRYYSKAGEDGDYILFKINGYPNNFVWPKAFPEDSFLRVLAEGMNKSDWHYYEVPETNVEAGDVVVDCGAAEGFFTFKHLTEAKHIYAVEPLPVFVEAMQKMFSGTGKVTVLALALLDKEGIAFLSDQNINSYLHLDNRAGSVFWL